ERKCTPRESLALQGVPPCVGPSFPYALPKHMKQLSKFQEQKTKNNNSGDWGNPKNLNDTYQKYW
ncbi:hypothetical protein, partial [Megasphaera stantonii]